ncbi:hypothetical protein [Paeniglutamicibacter psychrophenolicus]|uniref:hypothetical protein n=1 Tax=Paeniglutamicibacter psychrophenolicus TaxID=257454 RepID=UPI002781F13B|nr:hypothetical protein [Paeniglutamicibacter psychrophenolicus]MDQ0094621.1 hypothetical protein [Paeniglutamicibacter psychrophenolicus]
MKGIKPAHREEFRQTEPFTDDTDPQEVQDATTREDLGSGPNSGDGNESSGG